MKNKRKERDCYFCWEGISHTKHENHFMIFHPKGYQDDLIILTKERRERLEYIEENAEKLIEKHSKIKAIKIVADKFGKSFRDIRNDFQYLGFIDGKEYKALMKIEPKEELSGKVS